MVAERKQVPRGARYTQFGAVFHRLLRGRGYNQTSFAAECRRRGFRLGRPGKERDIGQRSVSDWMRGWVACPREIPNYADLILEFSVDERIEFGMAFACGLSVQEYDAKSESSHRRIPLSRDQLEALWGHRKRRNAEKLIAGSKWNDSGLFFTTRVGTPLNVQSLTYRSFRPLLEKAGCPQIRFHDQRHTFAVLALQNGMPSEVLKTTLGHSSIQVTIDYYGHLFPDYQDEVLGKMDDALATIDRAV